MQAISIKGLTKRFNGFTAVDGVSFDVNEGELFGLLGPNGAGKSTIMYMLTTLLEPTSGAATINGFDMRSQQDGVRKSIGIVFQDPTVDTRLSAYDNLDLHGRLYGMDAQSRKERINEVLELVELTDWKDKMVRTFSGGMRRRLEIARGLLHTPKILFLDEPTLGLDPQTRRHIWSYIEKLKKEGITIILTTHYLEEANYLCERVAIIDHGKIKVMDSPKNLRNAIGGSIMSIGSSDPEGLCRILKKNGLSDGAKIDGGTVSFTVKDGAKMVPKIMQLAMKGGISVESIEVHIPSLEDVFIYYTGSGIREQTGGEDEMKRRMMSHGH
jgi:ABC-2 type transport system ATP-binding protein